MNDDPDSMTEKPAAFWGRQSDIVKETLFGTSWLLTWSWFPHSMQSMYSLWVDYNDRSFFRPDSSSFRRQVLFCWSCDMWASEIGYCFLGRAWVEWSDSDQVDIVSKNEG